MVPWAQLEKYLAVHQVELEKYVDLKRENLMKVSDIE
jgi:hypothetical protein